MKLSKKAITGIIIGGILVVTIPLSSFALHFYRLANRFPSPFGPMSTELQQLLTNKGVTFPTSTEMKTFQDEMRQAQLDMKNLSTADKQAIEKATRDAMRAKGIKLPSEEEFTKLQTSMTQAKAVWDALSISEKASYMHASRNKMNEKFEGRKSFGRRGEKGMKNSRDESWGKEGGRGYEKNSNGFGFGMGFGPGFEDNESVPEVKTNTGSVVASTGTTATGAITGSGQVK